VEFTGAFAGGMEMSLSGPVLSELAANMLGAVEGEALTPGEQLDNALKELANVICRNLLPAIGGDKAEFNIHAPQAVPEGRPAWEDCAAGCCLALENGICRVQVRLDAG